MVERGAVRNPSVIAANQYRAHLRHTLRELYLAPAARARALTGVPTGDDEDAFDERFETINLRARELGRPRRPGQPRWDRSGLEAT